MISTDFRFYLEYDSNPFIIYDNSGHILYLNKSAELIMGIYTDREIYEFALLHAPQSFGHKTTLVDIVFNSFEFYGINILYDNDNELGVHLYVRPSTKISTHDKFDKYAMTDINLLLQANIELFSINYNGAISLLVDYELPEFMIHQNRFSLLLRKVFEQFVDVDKLNVELVMKIGTKVVIGDARYSIIKLQLTGNHQGTSHTEQLKNMALDNHINILFTKTVIALEIPIITSKT